MVTGASSGIGKAVAVECSKMGAIIIATGRDKVRLQETFSLLDQTKPNQQFAADLTQHSDIEKLVSTLPSLNGIVHCAAIIKKLPLKFISEKALQEITSANVFAPVILSQQIHKKKLLNSKGSVVFISSIASSVASLGNIMYMSTKGALNSLAKGMALELSEKGIRVNCIEPALIRTNLTDVLTQSDLENYQKKFPLGRFGKPEEIAYAAIYLLSDATEWMTGSIIKIDGGVTLC